MGVQIALSYPAFSSFGYIHRSKTAQSCGNSIFYFLKNHHIVFHRGCTILHSHQQCIRVPISPHNLNHTYFYLTTVTLMGVRCLSTVVLIYISLMISDFEHFFICLLHIYILSLEKILFKSFAHFLNQLGLLFLLLSCMSSSYTLDIINTLSDIWFEILSLISWVAL